MSIELAVEHRRWWWAIDDEDQAPELWKATASVSELAFGLDELSHVGAIDLVMVDLTKESNMFDSITVGEWALEFIAETVVDLEHGTLHPDLDGRITPGVPRMLIVRHLDVHEAWRGHGIGAALLASALRIFAPNARLAACRVSPADFLRPGVTRVDAELTSLRASNLLQDIGFRQWRGVHVVDLRDPQLLDVRLKFLEQWTPPPEGDAGVPAMTGADDQDRSSMRFEHLGHEPQPAFRIEVDGHQILVDHDQMASSLALLLLRNAGGVLRMPSSVWNRARDDVESAAPFGLGLAWDKEDDWLLVRLHEQPLVQIFEVRIGADGGAAGEVITRGGISGDEAVDRHIAIVRAVLGLNGGELKTALSRFVLAAYDVQEGHEWRVLVESDGEDALIHLVEPVKPPHLELLDPEGGQ